MLCPVRDGGSEGGYGTVGMTRGDEGENGWEGPVTMRHSERNRGTPKVYRVTDRNPQSPPERKRRREVAWGRKARREDLCLFISVVILDGD